MNTAIRIIDMNRISNNGYHYHIVSVVRFSNVPANLIHLRAKERCTSHHNWDTNINNVMVKSGISPMMKERREKTCLFGVSSRFIVPPSSSSPLPPFVKGAGIN